MNTTKFIYSLIVLLISCLGIKETQAQKLKIALVSVGEINEEHLEISKQGILSFYRARVKSPFKVTVEEEMLSQRWNKEKPLKMQVINAEAVNAELTELKNKNFDIIIGITDSALTIGEKLISEKMIIRGFAGEELQAATISTYKLKQESQNYEEFTANLTKVVRHEVGHVLGLRHCEASEYCLMLNGYSFENATPEFCTACLEKIDKIYLKK